MSDEVFYNFSTFLNTTTLLLGGGRSTVSLCCVSGTLIYCFILLSFAFLSSNLVYFVLLRLTSMAESFVCVPRGHGAHDVPNTQSYLIFIYHIACREGENNECSKRVRYVNGTTSGR